ncbi:MAG TPA: hypothetical protein VMU07_02750 [Candidatus Paceibacterota bacterium]|nr:hypothetical protein [Candidatus Paceibacterota bacterium]
MPAASLAQGPWKFMDLSGRDSSFAGVYRYRNCTIYVLPGESGIEADVSAKTKRSKPDAVVQINFYNRDAHGIVSSRKIFHLRGSRPVNVAYPIGTEDLFEKHCAAKAKQLPDDVRAFFVGDYGIY